jgi:hypothetical protein
MGYNTSCAVYISISGNWLGNEGSFLNERRKNVLLRAQRPRRKTWGTDTYQFIWSVKGTGRAVLWCMFNIVQESHLTMSLWHPIRQVILWIPCIYTFPLSILMPWETCLHWCVIKFFGSQVKHCFQKSCAYWLHSWFPLSTAPLVLTFSSASVQTVLWSPYPCRALVI